MSKIYLLGAMFFISIEVNSQVLTPIDVNFIIGEEMLEYPQMGTLVAPQFSEINLNNDNKPDLFVFDRSGNTVLCFINEGDMGEIAYRYAPEYNGVFPKTLHSWVIVKDFNGDGIEDIFTAPDIAGIPGIEVHRGRKDSEGILSFEKMTFDVGDYDILQILVNGFYTNVYVAFTDIPGIFDVDKDGDTDVITFDPGGSYASWYQNMAVEQGLGIDTFVMDIVDRCWGKFYENEFSQEITLSDNSSACATAAHQYGETRHSGSTICIIDADHDGGIDILLGDLASSEVVFMGNEGTSEAAWMTTIDHQFPSYDIPIDIDVFVSTFYIDVNNDGKKDLIAAPNTRNSGNLTDHIWVYLDKGDETVDFQLEIKDFLVNGALAMGDFSHPALLDIDGDNDKDLIVGVNGFYDTLGYFDSRLYLYENISTEDEITFKLLDDDYLNLSVISQSSGKYAPGVGDLDEDGDIDLMIGERNGQLIYFENRAGEGVPPIFNDSIFGYAGIDVGQHAKPVIIDLTGDGYVDLVVGERNDNREGDILGSINFFENKGGEDGPEFDPDSESEGNTAVLGAVFTRDPGYAVGSASPNFVPNNEDYYAFVGSESGKIRWYNEVSGNIFGEFNLISENLLPYKLGSNTTIVSDDINGDGFIDLIVGHSRGGVNFFSTDIKSGLGTGIEDSNIDLSSELRLFPNPAHGFATIEGNIKVNKIEVYDYSGKKVEEVVGNEVHMELPGVFYLKVFTPEGIHSMKWINF